MAMGRNRIKLSILLVAFAIAVPCLNAGIAEEDSFTKQLEEQARQAAENAYTPDPESIAQELYTQTRRSDLDSTNSTRRSLGKKYTGPCKVTNPIDKCWRCDPNWAKDRKKLAKCALGFGRKTTGGLKGQYYLVTDSSDSDLLNPKPGTFRHAVVQTRPLWIIFSKSMVITLQKELMITSNKTIDGRGHNVQFAQGAGLTVFLSSNVIIHNVKIYNIVAKDGGLIRDSETHYGIRTPSDGDGISIFGGSNVWIDHISMSNCADGLIDAIRGSTAITISNCHFTDHDHVMLFGASDTYHEDKLMQVTVAFNHFGKGLVQRMPRCRFGFFHVVNNDYTHWLMYAIGGSANATIISQGNRFIAPPNAAAREIAHRINAKEEVWKNWQWRSENDLLMNNATFLQSGPPLKHEQVTGENMIAAKHGNDVTWITRFSGVLNCVEGKPC